MKHIFLLVLLSTLTFSSSVYAESFRPVKPVILTKIRPKIEVVFAIDTTGSMSNLIGVAKSKIWSIANQLVTAKPTPEIKMGLIAYRDIGETYVTQVTPMTDDIDDIHEKLQALRAEGGGDGPEHVNQAMNDALTKIKWDKRQNVLRLIFLVGDAVAHDDYDDGLNSVKLAKAISANGIHLNTIRCGGDTDTKKQFMELAKLGGGNFVSIGNGTAIVSTPFDKKLAVLNGELSSTMIGFGERSDRVRSRKKSDARSKLAPSIAAANAGYSAKSGKMHKEDLLQAVESGTTLDKIPEKHFDEKMQKMSKAERKQHVLKTQQKRKRINKEILALSKKRDAYIRKETKKKAKKNSFDNRVMDTLKEQAKKINVVY